MSRAWRVLLGAPVAAALLVPAGSGAPALEPADPGAPPRTGGPGSSEPSANATLAAQMVSQGDRDADGALGADELRGLLESWYGALLVGGSPELTQEVLTRQYYRVLDPTVRSAGLIGGVDRNTTQPTALFLAADSDKDGLLARDELTASFGGWFEQWGGSAGSTLRADQIEAGLDAVIPRPQRGRRFRWRGRTDEEADFSPKDPVVGLPPQEQLARFELPPGYRMELALSEPAVEDPMAISFDGNGRMYVLELRTYMRDVEGTGTLLPQSRISFHDDQDGDGVYETHGVFLDDLVFPRFALPLDEGVVLTMESTSADIYAHRDTDGDGRADERELFATGMNRTDVNVEHMSSSLFWAMDNHLYVTTNDTRLRVLPEGVQRERIASNTGQWGISQDDYGRLFFQGGEIGVPVNFQALPVYGSFVVPEEFEPGYSEPWGPPGIADYQAGMRYVREDGSLNRVTGASGSQVFRGDRLPADLVGDYIYGEPVARIVRRSRVSDVEGLTRLGNVYQAERSEFIRCTDPLFRPVDVQTAPDGTLYVVDTYRGIIQESQWTPEGSYLRKKIQQYALDRNVGRGRIWRLRYDGIERDATRPRMLDQPAAELVPYLEHPNGWWRDQAQKLLVLRHDAAAVPALEEMARKGGSELGRIHALWALEGMQRATPDLVRAALADANPRIRAAAVRISETLYKAGDASFGTDLARLAREDPDPRVVIQAMQTLTYLRVPKSEDVVRFASANNPARGVREIGSQILSPRRTLFRMASELELYPDEQRQSLERGQEIYAALCVTCHAADGTGTPVPDTESRMAASFAGSPWVQGDPVYAISAVLYGLTGSRDEGERYMGSMVGLGGANPDQWTADVVSYVRNSFGNAASLVTAEEVARVRAANRGRVRPWPVPELSRATRSVIPYTPEWKLSASHNAAMVDFAINGSGAVSWTSGEPQAEGHWFQVDLSEATAVTGIEMVAPVAGDGYPRSFEVDVSEDGSSWRTVVPVGSATSAAVRVEFDAVSARQLRISLGEPPEEADPWAIQKLRIFAPPATEAPGSVSP